MKTFKICLSLIIFLAVPIHAQKDYFNPDDENAYKPCVKEFYRLLFSEKKVTIEDFESVIRVLDETDVFLKECVKRNSKNDCARIARERINHPDTSTSYKLIALRKYQPVLTQGFDYSYICQLIDLALIYDEGFEFGMYLELIFPNGMSVYFEMNKDTPKQILYIWLPTGESLKGLIRGEQGEKVEKLQRPGIINDPDGYTNIREKPDKNSAIVGKFVRNELFYYTPISGSDWWPVYKTDGGKQIGYVHKSRILRYIDFPPKLKEKVRKLRGGC
jgi:hypothetical protein